MSLDLLFDAAAADDLVGPEEITEEWAVLTCSAGAPARLAVLRCVRTGDDTAGIRRTASALSAKFGWWILAQNAQSENECDKGL